MKIFCVVDTNVIVSALLKRTSIPGKVVQHILEGSTKNTFLSTKKINTYFHSNL